MLIARGKKPVCKGYILYVSNYTTFWKKQNYGKSKTTCGCQEFSGREQGMNREAQGIETIL